MRIWSVLSGRSIKDSLISVNSEGAKISKKFDTLAALFAQQAGVFEEYQYAVKVAQEIKKSSSRRRNIPVRDSFVRKGPENEGLPRLSLIVSRGGRGGAVALKLYLALIWRCAAAPYETTIPARRWAELLALDAPKTKGARRVAKALDLLEALQLISLTRRPGEVSVVTLLDESGDRRAYLKPSDANVKTQEGRDRYFQISTSLWTSPQAYMQQMSSAAVTMLLLLLQSRAGQKDNESSTFGQQIWWSITRFQDLYTISPAMRSRGTKELLDLGLLDVQKQSVTSTGRKESFASERVRNTYRLCGAALETPQA